MKDEERLKSTLAPYYAQFEKLGDMYEDNLLSWEFLKRARRFFGRQYFFELRKFFKGENRLLRQECRVAKQKDNAAFAVKWRNIMQKAKAQRAAERQERKNAKASVKAERKRAKAKKSGEVSVTKEEQRAQGGQSS